MSSHPQSVAARRTSTASTPQHKSSRLRTAATSDGYDDNDTICAITESRGISPTVGLSFVTVSTGEAVLCQFSDTQTYVRTCHKIKVFAPSEILFLSSAAESKLVSIVTENVEVEKLGILMTEVDWKYWSHSSGHDYVQLLACPDDLEPLKSSIAGNHLATCCFSAVC